MPKTWVAADHHFGHRNIVKFLRVDGTKLRPFDTIEEHDEEIIRRHNELVKPEDRVYLLGDFGAGRYGHRLNGRKVLVKGNHDQEKLSRYDAFDDIRSYVVKKGFIMSHIPIHTGSMGRWQINIHGHLHAGQVRKGDWHDIEYPEKGELDPRYVCVSLEHTDYYPVDLQKLIDKYVET